MLKLTRIFGSVALTAVALLYLFWEPAADAIGKLLGRPISIGFALVCWFFASEWYDKGKARLEKLEAKLEVIEAKIDGLMLQATLPK